MAISMKNWKDRITQYPNRRKLINVSTGEETIVDVVRAEGNVTEDGDTFTAANMTDFESKIYNAIYPVGSIYMSVDNTNPSSLFGGTWVAWGAGRVPVGVDSGDSDFDTVEETGGSKTHSHWQSSGADDGNIYDTTCGNTTNTRVVTVDRIRSESAAAAGEGPSRQSATYDESSLQPYITCYMWKRTA